MKALVLTTALALLPSLGAAQQIAGVTSEDQVIYLSLQNGYQLCEIGKDGDGYALTDCKALKTPEAAGLAALTGAASGAAAAETLTADGLAARMKAELGCRIAKEDGMRFFDNAGIDEDELNDLLMELSEDGKIVQDGDYALLKTAGCE